MRVINKYMNKYSIDFELQSRVRKYLKYTLKNESNFDEENNLLNKLNKSLKKEVLMNSIGKLIHNIPFFSENFSENAIEQAAFSMKKIQMSPEEILYNVFFFLKKYITCD